jgi:hypothetical protein
MNSYDEVRRVRSAMSAAAGHDVRALIAAINERRPMAVSRIVDPGSKAEQTVAVERRNRPCSDGESTHAAH